MINVFVYGTLKPGQVNYRLYCANKVKESVVARVRGQLFDLPLGYPAMTLGESWVEGYLLTFAEEKILVDLDWLEDYREERSIAQNEYYRQMIPVYDVFERYLGEGWAYLMTREKIESLKGVVLPSGIWKGSS